VAHFVFGLRPQDEPFHLVHYLAIASCRAVLQPDEIRVHCHHLPYGFYWDLVRPDVVVERVERPAIAGHRYDDPLIARYSYAHEADVVRLDALDRDGGVYADIDTLFVAPPPPDLWAEPCVIGREEDPLDPRTGSRRRSLSNALIMASPGSAFVRRWRERLPEVFDGSWAAHSCFLAADLADEHPDDVRVEPERRFHPFAPTAAGLRRLLVEGEADLAGVSSIHLAAHLWWEQGRTDVLPEVSGRIIDERWVRSSRSTYAMAAARFLPDHGCF